MSYPIPRIATSTVQRLHSPELWRNALEKFDEPSVAQYYFDDFVTNQFANTSDASSAGGWYIQDGAAGGTSESFIATNGPNGIQTLSAATGTAHFSIEAHRGPAATTGATVNLPSHASAGKGAVVFEARVSLTAAHATFVGLTEAIAVFLDATSDVPTDSDYIGFYKEAAGDLLFVNANDNDGGTAVSSSKTILAAADVPTGYTKLGFRVNADQTVEIFVNGSRVRTDTSDVPIVVATTSLPIETLVERFVVGRGGGAATTVSLPIDWVATYVEE